MIEEKQYIKDYITQLDKKIKVYNECKTIIHSFNQINNSYDSLCNRIKNQFNLYYNHYITLNNNSSIRKIIEKNFNRSSLAITAVLINIEHQIQDECSKNFINSIFNHIDDIRAIHNIITKDKIQMIKEYIDTYNFNDTNTNVIDTLNRDLTELANTLKNLMDSIEMPYVKDANLELSDFFKDY